MRPSDVQIVHRDGSRVLCELAALGVGADGIEYWEIATELQVGDELWIGFMPAMTSIVAPLADDVDARRIH